MPYCVFTFLLCFFSLETLQHSNIVSTQFLKKTILDSYYQIIKALAMASFVTRQCVVLKGLIEALSDDILSFLA